MTATIQHLSALQTNFTFSEPGLVKQRPHFFIKMGARYRKMDWNDVVYMRSEKGYTSLFNASDEKEYLIRGTLIKTLQDIVPSHMRTEFVQINRGEAVNLTHITEFSGDIVKTQFNSMYLSESYSKLLKGRVIFLT